MYQCGTVSEVLLLERIEGSEISEAREVIQLLHHPLKEGPGFFKRLYCFTDRLAHRLHDLGSRRRDVGRACWGSGEDGRDTTGDPFPAVAVVAVAVIILRAVLRFWAARDGRAGVCDGGDIA